MNLNRFLPSTVTEAKLTKRFIATMDTELIIHFGFSDGASISLDGQQIFEGVNEFKTSPNWEEQGYVFPDKKVSFFANSGEHRMEIVMRKTESFGWGLILSILGEHLQLLDCEGVRI